MARPHTVLILGGTGFIGRRIVTKLAGTNWRATLSTRRYAHARDLALLPYVEQVIEANVHDDDDLMRLVQGHDAVINLVGILHAKPGPAGSRYGHDFARAHVDLPRRLAAACAAHGVRRFLHMSALGVSKDAPSMYLRSKADGEAAARSQPGVAPTIFRPSVVFGPADNFLNLFASLQKWLPLMPLGSADARFQPVYVDDVAEAFLHALENPRTAGEIYELAGPHIYTLRELVKLAGRYAGHRRPVIALPSSLSRWQALVLEYMPGGPLMSRDNLASMQIDSVAHTSGLEKLGIQATPLEAVAPFYLRKADRPQGSIAAR